MFSWTTGRSRGGSSTATAVAYPGNRGRNNSNQKSAVVAATPIRGSIRAPSSSSSFSRQQHLESYLKDETLGPSTMQVSSDDTTQDTVFTTTAGDTLILRVHLPSLAFGGSSSVRCPEMTLVGVELGAPHSWLDAATNRIVGLSAITSDAKWRSSGLLLGSAVKETVLHLQLNPPEIANFLDPNLRKMQKKAKTATTLTNNTPPAPDAPPSYDSLWQSTSSPRAEPTTSSSSSQLPTIPTTFPFLEDLDREALDDVLKMGRDSLQGFCSREVPDFTLALKQATNKVYQSNREQAEEQLTQQTVLQELDQEVQELHSRLETTVTEFQSYQEEQEKYCQAPDQRVLIKELQKAKKQAFEESERLADAWLDSEDCADMMGEFCSRFLEERKTHHLRAAKIQVLQQQQVKTI